MFREVKCSAVMKSCWRILLFFLIGFSSSLAFPYDRVEKETVTVYPVNGDVKYWKETPAEGRIVVAQGIVYGSFELEFNTYYWYSDPWEGFYSEDNPYEETWVSFTNFQLNAIVNSVEFSSLDEHTNKIGQLEARFTGDAPPSRPYKSRFHGTSSPCYDRKGPPIPGRHYCWTNGPPSEEMYAELGDTTIEIKWTIREESLQYYPAYEYTLIGRFKSEKQPPMPPSNTLPTIIKPLLLD